MKLEGMRKRRHKRSVSEAGASLSIASGRAHIPRPDLACRNAIGFSDTTESLQMPTARCQAARFAEPIQRWRITSRQR